MGMEEKMRKTTLKTTHRKSGWTTLITMPWGEKVRILSQPTKFSAEESARMFIERKRAIENDPATRELLVY
jgi:hypothetical protein